MTQHLTDTLGTYSYTQSDTVVGGNTNDTGISRVTILVQEHSLWGLI